MGRAGRLDGKCCMVERSQTTNQHSVSLSPQTERAQEAEKAREEEQRKSIVYRVALFVRRTSIASLA